MGWNGSGVVTLLYDFTADRDAGSPSNIISADKFDALLSDLGGSIEECLNRNGENSVAANINWGGFKVTNLGAATAANDAVRARQIAENSIQYGGTTGGSSNAYTATVSMLTSLGTGTRLLLRANHANTGAATLAVNGGSAISIVGRDGSSALRAGEISINDFFEVAYDGTQFVLVNGIYVNPAVNPIEALTPAADRLAYYTSASAAALATITSFARTILDDEDAAAARTTIGLPFSVIKDYAFDTGTVQVFHQAAAPTSWTISVTFDDYALRVVSSGGGDTSGGSAAFSSIFAARTIAETNLPAHAHGVGTFAVSAGGNHGHPFRLATTGDDFTSSSGGIAVSNNTPTDYAAYTGALSSTLGQQIGASGTHVHGLTGSSGSIGSGTAMDFNVRTLDMIRCIKN